MSENDDLDYLETRYRQSLELAEEAVDVSVRKIHREMARAYEAKIASAKAVPVPAMHI